MAKSSRRSGHSKKQPKIYCRTKKYQQPRGDASRYPFTVWNAGGISSTPAKRWRLFTLCRLVEQVQQKSGALAELLALNVSRAADYSTSLCSWKNTSEKLNHTFGTQACLWFGTLRKLIWLVIPPRTLIGLFGLQNTKDKPSA